MSFLAIILALLLDRLLLEDESYRQHHWFNTYAAKAREYLPETPWAPLLLLTLPLLAIAWLQSTFDHGLAALIFGCTLLLFTLGPRDLDREANRIIDQLESGQCDYQAAFEQLTGRAAPGVIAARRLTESILSQANTRLFSVLFWFVILGPLGAALYRLTRLAQARCAEERKSEAGVILERLLYLLEWVPARLTALTYAMGGSYENAMQGWRRCNQEQTTDQNRAILEASGMGALFPGDDQLPPAATQMEAALGMTWRALLIWLGILAFGVLIQ